MVLRLEEPPTALTIARDGQRVVLTDGEGRTIAYVADGRTEKQLSSDGEFMSRAQFDGGILIVEEDFGDGMRLTSRYEPVAGDRTQFLEVTLQVSAFPKLQRPAGPESGDKSDGALLQLSPDGILRVYERAFDRVRD